MRSSMRSPRFGLIVSLKADLSPNCQWCLPFPAAPTARNAAPSLDGRCCYSTSSTFPHFEKWDRNCSSCGMHRRCHGPPAAQDDDDDFMKAWRPLELGMSPISADICRFPERVNSTLANVVFRACFHLLELYYCITIEAILWIVHLPTYPASVRG